MIGYQIRQVSEMLGVPRNTLIAWERRYGIVQPHRSPAGYRLYTEEHVDILRRVKALVDEGFRAGDACRMVLEEVEKAREAKPPVLDERAERALSEVRGELLNALLSYDQGMADELASRLVMVPFERVLDEVYLPMLREVGTGWEHGDIDVAQEHFVTAWCREKLVVMLHAVRSTPRSAAEIVCATPPGERHELGLLTLAVRLSIRGFRVIYLGVNVPTSDLVNHVQARQPFAVCLSLIHSRKPSEVVAYARELRRKIPEQVRIAMGGRGADVDGVEVPGVAFATAGLPNWAERREENRLSGRRIH
jgi:DNA-binding transcriptional MerR regulator/methylmalonyl-CoA mutase cobalamin-binding subunit